jgi:hypothetical protein
MLRLDDCDCTIKAGLLGRGGFHLRETNQRDKKYAALHMTLLRMPSRRFHGELHLEMSCLAVTLA